MLLPFGLLLPMWVMKSSTAGKGHEIKCGAIGNMLGGVDTFKTCGIWWEHHGNFMGMSKSHEFNALKFDGNVMGTSKFKPILIIRS